MRINDSEQFQEQRSRWKRDVFRGVRCKEYWLLMKLSFRAKSPLDHFMNVMQVSGGTLSGNGLFRYLVFEGRASKRDRALRHVALAPHRHLADAGQEDPLDREFV